jgi:hypothetical protein
MLSERVRYLVVWTHSRKIDGDLLLLLFRAVWILEHERKDYSSSVRFQHPGPPSTKIIMRLSARPYPFNPAGSSNASPFDLR